MNEEKLREDKQNWVEFTDNIQDFDINFIRENVDSFDWFNVWGCLKWRGLKLPENIMKQFNYKIEQWEEKYKNNELSDVEKLFNLK